MSRRHFCCCIPVRAGVFAFSLLSGITSAFLAVELWFQVRSLMSFTVVYENASAIGIVSAVFYTIVTIASVLGLVGAISRKRTLINAYYYTHMVTFFLMVTSSGILLYSIYSGKDIMAACVSFLEDGRPNWGTCRDYVPPVVKIIITVLVVFLLLIHLCTFFVVRRYIRQLDEEANSAAWGGSYENLDLKEEVDQGLSYPVEHYSYAEPGPEHPFVDDIQAPV